MFVTTHPHARPVRRLYQILCLVFLAPTVLPAQAHSQIPADTAAARDTVAPHTLRSIGVVARRARYQPRGSSTALRTLTPLLETPQAVAVVGRNLIDDQAMQGLSDVLQYIPGARMGQGEGNRDQPTLRGNSSTSSFFVDGMRDDVQYVRDLYNVDRVEALLGANALLFGRGGTGGIINRVTKVAGPTVHEIRLSAGSFGARRGAIDIGQAMGGGTAVRGNAMYEHSDLFRRGAFIDRIGINPTVTVTPGPRTTVTASVEYFHDERTADRGVPSFAGRPVQSDPATFFGNAEASRADARVLAGDAVITHQLSDVASVRSQLHMADYDKFYQNVYPGAVDVTGRSVRISAYSNATARSNLFSQTDLTARLRTGAVRHTMLIGLTFGRQVTDNFRNTGYFNNTDTSVDVPLGDPVTNAPITFRQSERDADNRAETTTAALYAQDQVALSERWRLVGGVGVERFGVTVRNHREGSSTSRTDVMVSPRAAVLYKLADAVSLYGSYSVSALPSSGDQFSSLDATTATLEPEQFRNLEAGAKWDVAGTVALSVAAYQLDRSKSRSLDPTDPSRTVQSGSQRSRGIEVGVQGSITRRWQVAGGYALQHAVVTSATTAAPEGAIVPLVPRHSSSLWNRIWLVEGISIGAGVVRQGESYTALDNTVTLPAYTRFDAAAFVRVTSALDVQANVENLFGTRYFLTSHSNNNISPGAPRSLRVALSSRF